MIAGAPIDIGDLAALLGALQVSGALILFGLAVLLGWALRSRFP